MHKIIFSNYDDINNPHYGGGGARAVHEVAKRLAQDFEVTVITGKYRGAKDEIIDRVKYRRLGTDRLGPKIGQLVFQALLIINIKKLDFDLWVESFTPPFSVSLLPRLAKKPVIGLAHTLAGRDAARKYRLPFYLPEKRGLKHYPFVIAVSDFLKQEIALANPQSKVAVIPNGVDLPKPANNAGRHILFLGRMEINQKGLDLLLKAFAQIKDQTQLPLLLAGAGPAKEERKLKAMIADLGLQGCARLLGRVDEEQKAALLGQAAAVVVPSRFETFSLAALEALSHGVPVAAFDIPGLKWLPKTAAKKIAAFDMEGLAQAMRELADDRVLRQRLGQAGRRLAKQYSWESAALQYKSFFAGVLAQNNSRTFPSFIETGRLRRIVARHLPCYFISPHLDDAVLSAGDLLNYLSGKAELTVVTVFTQAGHEDLTLSARRFLRQCGYLSAEKLFADRRKEDIAVLNKLGVRAVHLDFPDALWRKKSKPGQFIKLISRVFPEALHLYPTYRWHAITGRIHRQDALLLQSLAEELKSLVLPDREVAIFCPAGFGSHVDHVLARKACEQVFADLIFWKDLPYAAGSPQQVLCRQALDWPGDSQAKLEALAGYRTQFKALFPKGKTPKLEETYYI